MIKFSKDSESTPQILVLGIGGAGCSVIDKINNYNTVGVNTFFIDADQDTVNSSTAMEKLCIPTGLIRELYAETPGISASKELAKKLKSFVNGLPKAEIVFTISGLGGTTGTVITPILVQLLRERSLWVWSLTTLPFFFEGKPKILNSLKRLKLVQQSANAIMVIPHDKIFKMVDKTLSMKEAFTPANNLCAELVLDISRLTQDDAKKSWINIKFSDIKDRIVNKRSTSLGIGEATGESRIQMAIEQAILSPLLGKDVLSSAESLILSIRGGETITLDEVNSGIKYLHRLISRDIDVIFGVAIDPMLKDSVKVGIITTGIDTNSNIDNWDLSLSTGMPKDIKKMTVFNRLSQQSQKPQQTMIDFKKLQKGSFEKSEATIYGGVDIDVPTFLRKKK